MTQKQKEKEMTRLWCEWNRNEISGEDFAHAIGELYNEETLATWNDPLEKLFV